MDSNQELIYRPGIILKKQDSVNLAIAFYFAYSIVNATVGSLNGIISTVCSIGSYVFLLLVINALPSILKSFRKVSLLYGVVFIVVYIVSYAIASDTEIHMMAISTILRFCIPVYLLGISVRNVDDLLNKLRIVAWIDVICQILSIFVFQTNSVFIYAYSQDTGYEALLSFAILIIEYRRRNKLVDLIGAFLSLFFVLIAGARGPLFCVCIVTAGVVLFIVEDRSNKQRTLFIFILVVTAAMVLLFYQNVLNVLITLFRTFGLSTRILDGLLYSNIAEDSGRLALAKTAWNYASDHLLFGTGLVNDRRYLYDILHYARINAFGTYCHNFFLEVFMQIGLLPGIIISVLLINRIKLFLSRKVTYECNCLCLVLAAVGFIPLMVSFSYLTEPKFSLFLGFLLTKESDGHLESAE